MRDELHRLIDRLMDDASAFPWEAPQAYADFLAQTFYFTSHSTRLLALAASRCPAESAVLHRGFIQHLGEEDSHELLALEDLRGLGAEVETYPERVVTRALYETQYFKIEHLGSTAFYGYVIVLEGLAAIGGPELYRRVVRAHGDGCARFLRVHTLADIDHLATDFERIETLDEGQKADIGINMIQSAEFYGLMLRQIARDHGGAFPLATELCGAAAPA